jgi:hypothetical protein
MTPAEAGQITSWLTVIAIASVVQTLAIVGLCIGAVVTARRLDRRIDTLQREVIAPAAARAEVVMHKVEALVDRDHTIDERVSGTLNTAGSTVGLAAAVVGRKFWPVLGLVQAARAGFAAMGRRRAAGAAADGTDRARDARTQSQRTEGGTTHARSV